MKLKRAFEQHLLPGVCALLLLAPLAIAAEMPYAMDRDGNRTAPVIAARDHCAWPNLKLLKDGKTCNPVRIIDWNGADGGYPSSVQRADGEIVTAYYCSALPGEPPDSAKSYHMEVIVWNADRTFPKP